MTNLKNLLDCVGSENLFTRTAPKAKLEVLENLFLQIANAYTHNNYSYGVVKEYVQKLLSWAFCLQGDYKLMRGWCLSGNTGVGKTLTMQLFKIFLEFCKLNYQIGNTAKRYFNGEIEKVEPKSLSLCNMFIVDARDIVNDYSADGVNGLEKYFKCSCLCIDDMGTEEEGNYFGTKKNVLAELISAREKSKLMTFATCNNLEQLTSKFDDRTLSRFVSLFNFLEYKGINDFRLNK